MYHEKVSAMKDQRYTPDPNIQPTILYDLTTVGDAYVELRATDGPLPEADTFERHIAGSAAHIAIYHSMLGGKSACIASVGADPMGTFVQQTLRNHRVVVTGMQFSREHQTSLLFASRAGRFFQTSYYRISDWQLHNTKEHVAMSQASRIVHGAGFCLWKHPARHSIFEILRLTKKFNSTTILQPQYIPALWRDRNDAMSTIKKTLQFADIATPTVDDAENLFGKMSHEDMVKKFHEIGAHAVILTMGKDGCLVSKDGELEHVPAIEAEIVDPSGVHDAWHAGLYYAVNHGKQIYSAVQYANAVGAYVLGQHGTLVQLPAGEELAQTMLEKPFADI
jgi:fructokinase